MALTGTKKKKTTDKSRITETRAANHNIVTNIYKGKMPGEEAEGWLAMFEKATSGMEKDDLIKTLRTLPLYVL